MDNNTSEKRTFKFDINNIDGLYAELSKISNGTQEDLIEILKQEYGTTDSPRYRRITDDKKELFLVDDNGVIYSAQIIIQDVLTEFSSVYFKNPDTLLAKMPKDWDGIVSIEFN